MTNPAEIPSASPPSTPPEAPKALTREELRAEIEKAKTEQEHGTLADNVVKSGSQKSLDADSLKLWSNKLQELKTETMKQFNEGIGAKAEEVVDDAEHLRAVDKELAILDTRMQFLTELAKKSPEGSAAEIPTAEHFLERNFSKGKDAVVKFLTNSKNATGLMMASVISKLPMSALSTFVDQITIFIAKQMKDVPFIGEYAKNFVATKEKKIAVREIGELIKKANKPGQQPKIMFDSNVSELELETINPETLKKTAAQLVVDCQKYKNVPEITLTVANFANPQAFLQALDAKQLETPTPEQKKAMEDIATQYGITNIGTVTLNTRNEFSAKRVDGKWNVYVDASQFKDGIPTANSSADVLKTSISKQTVANALRITGANTPIEFVFASKEMQIPSTIQADDYPQLNLFEVLHTSAAVLRIAKANGTPLKSPGAKIIEFTPATNALLADSTITAEEFRAFSSIDPKTSPTNKWEYKSGNWTAVATAVPATPPAAPKP